MKNLIKIKNQNFGVLHMLVGNLSFSKNIRVKVCDSLYKHMKVNSYAMKLYPPCVHIFFVSFAWGVGVIF
jgi:hypothetical protein